MGIRRWGFLAVLAAMPLTAEAVNANQVFLTKQKQAELRAARPFSVEAAARKKLEYFGGPVIANAQVYSVMWGSNVDSEVQKRIGGMFTATLASTYLDQLSQYSTNISSAIGTSGTNQMIGRGSYGGSFTIQPANGGVDLDDSEVGAELEAQINSGAVPAPGPDSVYFLYFPPGVSISIDGAKSCEVFCGYHHSVATRSHGTVYYSVQPDLGGACAMGCGFASTPFDNMTVITAHELAEAITDPAVQGNAQLGPPIGWATSQGEEIGDLCASELTTLTASDGTVYNIQQAFDNSIARCNKGPFRQ